MNVADHDVHTVTVANVRRRNYKSLREVQQWGHLSEQWIGALQMLTGGNTQSDPETVQDQCLDMWVKLQYAGMAEEKHAETVKTSKG